MAKKVHHGYFRTPTNQDIKPFPIYNIGQSFNKFWEKLCRFKEKHMLDEVAVGFESTGAYAEPISNYLRKRSVKLVQINPMHTKRIKELTDNSPNKTDTKDPRVIADVISLGHSLTVVVPEGAVAQLRRLTQARERAIERRKAMINQLHSLVFVIFPELVSIIKPSTKTGMYLIKNYLDPESIVSIGMKTFGSIVRKISRGKIGIDRAEKLYHAVKASLGITDGKESALLETSHLVSNLENEKKYIEGLEEQMIAYLEQIPYSHSILSVKGIGNITVAGLIGEVGDFRRFKTISEVMKLAGLNLFEVSSGKHEGGHNISKRGRSLMRKRLFLSAINTVRSHGVMHERYQRMLKNGTPKIKALVAVPRKLLRIIFALTLDNTKYDENYNRKHEYKLAA